MDQAGLAELFKPVQLMGPPGGVPVMPVTTQAVVPLGVPQQNAISQAAAAAAANSIADTTCVCDLVLKDIPGVQDAELFKVNIPSGSNASIDQVMQKCFQVAQVDPKIVGGHEIYLYEKRNNGSCARITEPECIAPGTVLCLSGKKLPNQPTKQRASSSTPLSESDYRIPKWYTEILKTGKVTNEQADLFTTYLTGQKGKRFRFPYQNGQLAKGVSKVSHAYMAVENIRALHAALDAHPGSENSHHSQVFYKHDYLFRAFENDPEFRQELTTEYNLGSASWPDRHFKTALAKATQILRSKNMLERAARAGAGRPTNSSKAQGAQVLTPAPSMPISTSVSPMSGTPGGPGSPSVLTAAAANAAAQQLPPAARQPMTLSSPSAASAAIAASAAVAAAAASLKLAQNTVAGPHSMSAAVPPGGPRGAKRAAPGEVQLAAASAVEKAVAAAAAAASNLPLGQAPGQLKRVVPSQMEVPPQLGAPQMMQPANVNVLGLPSSAPSDVDAQGMDRGAPRLREG